MSRVDIDIEITTPEREINRRVLKSVVSVVNKAFRRAVAPIKASMQRVTLEFFLEHEITDALRDEDNPQGLPAHFGFPEGTAESRIYKILERVIRQIDVRFTPFRVLGANNISGGLTIGIIKDDFSELLNMRAAIVTNNSSKNRGQELPWLEWLLIRGNEVIVSEHSIRFGNFKSSRSGHALMISNTAGTWKVPAQFSGTEEDNWLTRAVLDSFQEYQSATSRQVERHVKRNL